MASTYAATYARWKSDPSAFWSEAAGCDRLVQGADVIFDGERGVYGRWFPDGGNQHLLQLPRPSCRGRPRRADGADLRQPGDRPEAALLPIGEMLAEVEAIAAVLADLGVGARRPRDHLHADGARGGLRHARLRPHRRRPLRRFRRVSRRTNWPPASMTARRRWSSLPAAASSRAASSPTSRCSTRQSRWPATSRSTASCCSAPNWRRRWPATATSILPQRSRRQDRPDAPCPAFRCGRPTRSISSTRPERPASRRACCATMAGTWSRSPGA